MQKLMITKEKITGMIGTAIFMILLLVILLFSYFTLANPSEDMGGIPVMFGSMEEAGGFEEPPMDDIIPQEVMEVPTPQNNPTDIPLIAQVDEPSIVIKDKEIKQKEEEERKKQAMLEEQRRQREEAERKRREEEARKQDIKNQVSGAFGKAEDANRGETEGKGTQGVSTGNASQGQATGIGGMGSFDLGGRSVGSGGLILPKYTVDEEGTVVVDITVNPNGNVIHAEIGKKTTTGNSTLRNEALKAAQNTKFNSINAKNDQRGTITYRFRLN